MSSGVRRALALFFVALAACAGSPGTRPDARRANGDTRAAAARGAAVAGPEGDTDGDGADDDADAEVDGDAARRGEREGANESAPCPRNMALVDGRFCVDRYEASLVEVLADGTERAYPHYASVDGHAVRAVSEPGVFPQGYVSEVQARDACAASGKRLCSYAEWKTACMGPSKTTFPYGDTRRAGVCHDSGKSAVVAVFGAKAVAASPVSPIIAAANAPRNARPAHVASKGRAAHTTKARATKPANKDKKDPGPRTTGGTGGTGGTNRTSRANRKKPGKAPASAKASARPSTVEPNVWTQLNDARLGQVEGAVARTGEHPDCTNGWGLFDMVGNLHEWVATDPSTPTGTFAGGYYLDTSLNGDGCQYKTQAHAHEYHDYSTGFRCCADPAAAR